ncbi:MAG: hypothetical protein Q4C95_09935 [Planctomycetia bacterium]|nr:hypothetical protein [Planctomycetia bacterium]
MKTTWQTVFLLSIVFWTLASVSSQAQNWYKGGIHMHTFWSDGNVFPEYMADLHREMGYHFIVPSDHSQLQTNKDRWKEIAADHPQVKAYVDKYGDWVEQKEIDGKHFVRLKTIDELKSKLDDPGKFLLIPGHEQNVTIGKGSSMKSVHANVINIAETIPFPPLETPAECARVWQKNCYESGAQNGLNSLWTLNHPFWVHYDIVPQDLIEVPEVWFYELNTCGKEIFTPNPYAFSRDKFWDIICAFRIIQGNHPIYCAGADDSHNHLVFRDFGCNPGLTYVVVRADELEANKIVQAMKEGDFYTSTGVTLDNIIYNAEKRSLTVKIKPEDGVHYRIDFIGTKKDFDQTTVDHLDPAEIPEEEFKSHTQNKPTRMITEYSNDIGKVFQTTEGIEATYQLADDDLYVRALITSDKKPKFIDNHTPETETAWTQPVGWEKFIQDEK